MLLGFVRVVVVIAVVAFIAATSVIGIGLLIDSTQKLTMSATDTDGTFYADLTGDCDYSSVTCG